MVHPNNDSRNKEVKNPGLDVELDITRALKIELENIELSELYRITRSELVPKNIRHSFYDFQLLGVKMSDIRSSMCKE
jgi:hypothetical protein